MNHTQIILAVFFTLFGMFFYETTAETLPSSYSPYGSNCNSCKQCCTNCRPGLSCVLNCDVCPAEDLFTEIATPTLRAVHVVMRHGNRAPIFSYPKDPYANDTARWKRGPGELTNAGIIQMRNFGKYLKARYAEIVSCDPKTRVNIRSSQTNRCIESTKVVAKVLCPPSSDIYDLPTTVLCLPAAVDNLLYWRPYCPTFTREAARVNKSPDWLAHIAKRKVNKMIHNAHIISTNAFYETIIEQSGFNPDDSVKAVESVYDVLITERYEGLPSPDWVTDEILEMLKEEHSTAFNILYSSNITLRLQVGPLLNEISGSFKKRILSERKETDNTPITIYGTHDDKITAILNAIGAKQKDHPPFAASVLFELHNINGLNYVAVRYLDQTEKTPYSSRILSIPCSDKNQNEMCFLDEFIRMIDLFIPNDWREECDIPKEFDPYKTLVKCGAATSDRDLEYCLQFD